MLYTRKGDDGTTRAFDSGPGKRISKSSCQTESLGALDELNSFLGLVKIKANEVTWLINGKKLSEIIHLTQERLFIIQAELAGADKKISENHVSELEKFADEAEKQLPPIKSFSIPGGTEISALLDVARTLARKVERRTVDLNEKGGVQVSAPTLAFLNRLSSLFYALARLSNHKSGIKESAPTYQ